MNHKTPSILPHLTFDTAASPSHSIIWLHGLGADGHDFLPIAKQIRLALPMRYIFPHAPLQAVTLNGGMLMRSWYDILPSDLAPELNHGRRTQADVQGILLAQSAINQLIAQEHARGVAYKNIFLAGFSQGGALALHTALRHEEALGGLLALSTYMPLAETLSAQCLQTKTLPIFMAHGRQDGVVAYTLGKYSKEILLNQGYTVDWYEYTMPHSVCAQELSDIESWLNQQLKT